MNKKKEISIMMAAMLCFTGCSSTSSSATQTTANETTAASETTKANETTAASETTEANETTVASETTENSNIIELTDLIGRKVTIDKDKTKRVVCIGAGALRMYTYIGDVSLLCGVEDIDNETLAERPKMFDASARPYVLAFGDVFSQLDSCGVGGPNAQTAEAEKILSCKPDLVISEYEDVEKEDALEEQLGVPVVTLKSGKDGVFGEEFKNSMMLLGTIFGKEERAEELVSYVEDQTKELSDRTGEVSEEDYPSVYICGLGNWGTTNYLTTANNYKPFEIIHVNNVASDLSAPGVQPIEKEKFESYADNIDYIFMDAAAVKNMIPLYAEDPEIFDSCKAYAEDHIYLEMAYNAYYTNYEIALANAWFMAKTVYPDLFDDVDLTDKMNQITNEFFGMELAEEIYSCPSSFGGYQKIDVTSFFSQK